MQITDCSAYEILQKERIEDVHADGYLLRHKKSGARVMLLANQDENKVFNIIFRTPPAGSKLQRPGIQKSDARVYGCSILSEYL